MGRSTRADRTRPIGSGGVWRGEAVSLGRMRATESVAASVAVVRRPLPFTQMARGVKGRERIVAYFSQQIPIRRRTGGGEDLFAKVEEAYAGDYTKPGVKLPPIESLRTEAEKAAEKKAEKQLADIYSKLDPWQKTQVARHADRPRYQDYVGALVTDYVELSGDRVYGEDAAILGDFALGEARMAGTYSSPWR